MLHLPTQELFFEAFDHALIDPNSRVVKDPAYSHFTFIADSTAALHFNGAKTNAPVGNICQEAVVVATQPQFHLHKWIQQSGLKLSTGLLGILHELHNGLAFASPSQGGVPPTDLDCQWEGFVDEAKEQPQSLKFQPNLSLQKN